MMQFGKNMTAFHHSMVATIEIYPARPDEAHAEAPHDVEVRLTGGQLLREQHKDFSAACRAKNAFENNLVIKRLMGNLPMMMATIGGPAAHAEAMAHLRTILRESYNINLY